MVESKLRRLWPALLICGISCGGEEAGSPPSPPPVAPGPGGGGGGGAPSAAAGGKGPGLELNVSGSSAGGSGGAPCSQLRPELDGDGDGVTPAQGDCNDCDPVTRPGAYDFPGNGIDEDCSKAADDEVTSCEDSLAIEGDDATDAARAMGLCRMQEGQGWGLVAARWVFPDGATSGAEVPADFSELCARGGDAPNPQSRGILQGFGANVTATQGTRLVALSTGVARSGANTAAPPGQGSSPDGASMCTFGQAPPGFPKDSPSCPEVVTANNPQALDAVALELEIKTPSNARGLSFEFNFYTFEWPDYVCTDFNDFFVALLRSADPGVPTDENISFDSMGNSVSVNNGFVDRCDPQLGALRPGGKDFPCAEGTAELEGTGFDDRHAATGWLKTTSAIVPGETIRLRFAIWDMGDQAWDSTVLLDNLRWEVTAGSTPVTERPPQVPK